MTAHMWLPGLRNGSPILACGSCHRVWWPDQRTPKPNCPGPDLAAIGRRDATPHAAGGDVTGPTTEEKP